MSESTVRSGLCRISNRLVAVAMLAGLVGCASSGLSSYNRDPREIEPDERAILINNHLNAGRDLIVSLEKDYENDPTDPRQADRNLVVFEEALGHFREARRLDGATKIPSSKPRMAVANCLHSMAVLQAVKFKSVSSEIAALEEAGRPVPAELRQRAQADFERMQVLAERSNREFDFYARNLYISFPAPIIFEYMARNNEMLERWNLAAQSMRRFLDEARLSEDQRNQYLKLVKGYQDRAFDALDDGR